MNKITIFFLCIFFATVSAQADGQGQIRERDSFASNKLRSKQDLYSQGSKRIIEPIDEYLDMSRLTVYGLVKEEGCEGSLCPKNVIEHEWNVGPWGDCEDDKIIRTVTCNNSVSQEIVDDTLCSQAQKPIDTKSCGLDNNIYYTWIPSSFTQCDNLCGWGDRTRTVSCYDNSFNKVADEFCTNVNPYITDQECVSYEDCPFKWIVGEWSECLEGSKSRSVECIDGSGNLVSTYSCYRQTWSEPESESYDCQDLSTYHREFGEWGECVIISTDEAYQYRTSRCVDSNGVVVGDIFCPSGGGEWFEGGGDSTTQRECIGWILSNWSECSSDNIRTRSLYCGSPIVYEPYDEVMCSDIEKPNVALSESCTMSLYGWHALPWEARCNDLPAIRDVECRQKFTGKKVDDSLCDESEKPNEISGPRDEDAPSDSCYYEWQYGDWQKCTMIAGQLQHIQNVVCVKAGSSEGSDYVVDNSYCEQFVDIENRLEPGMPEPCNYSWEVDPWSVCNHETLKKTRSVQCREQYGEVFDDSMCSSLGVKPENFQSCDLDFYWDYTYSLNNNLAECEQREMNSFNRDLPVCWGYKKCPTNGLIPFREDVIVCIAAEKGKDISTGHVVPNSVCHSNPNTIGVYEKYYMPCIYHPYGQSSPLPVSKCNAGCKKQGTRTWTINDCVWANYYNGKFWPSRPHQIHGYDAEICLAYSIYIEVASNDLVPYWEDEIDESTYLALINNIPYIDRSNIHYTNSDHTSLTYTESCTGTCGGTWVVSGASQCMFNNHFSSGGFMNITYGCKEPDSWNVVTDENMMPCDPDTKPVSAQIGCYYNISDPSEMTRINGLISQYVQNTSQYDNGEIVPGSALEELMYNLNGYSNP